MYHLWSFSLQKWKQKTENNPKIKVPSSILNWNYCCSSMKQTPLACLRCPHPFGLWWPPMAPIPGAVGRAFACVGPWLPVACGETEAITAGPWLARPRAPSPISHHGFLLRHPQDAPWPHTLDILRDIPFWHTCVHIECFPLVHFGLHPKGPPGVFILLSSLLLFSPSYTLIRQVTLDPNDRLMIKTSC